MGQDGWQAGGNHKVACKWLLLPVPASRISSVRDRYRRRRSYCRMTGIESKHFRQWEEGTHTNRDSQTERGGATDGVLEPRNRVGGWGWGRAGPGAKASGVVSPNRRSLSLKSSHSPWLDLAVTWKSTPLFVSSPRTRRPHQSSPPEWGPRLSLAFPSQIHHPRSENPCCWLPFIKIWSENSPTDKYGFFNFLPLFLFSELERETLILWRRRGGGGGTESFCHTNLSRKKSSFTFSFLPLPLLEWITPIPMSLTEICNVWCSFPQFTGTVHLNRHTNNKYIYMCLCVRVGMLLVVHPWHLDFHIPYIYPFLFSFRSGLSRLHLLQTCAHAKRVPIRKSTIILLQQNTHTHTRTMYI